MEQRDFLLREIEKMGAIVRAISQRLFGGDGNQAITIEKQKEDAKGMLLDGANFDLGNFLSLTKEDSNEYINSFKGFSPDNIELMAEWTYQIGMSDKSNNSKLYLEKALQLYELCNIKSKTYSFKRAAIITEIENEL